MRADFISIFYFLDCLPVCVPTRMPLLHDMYEGCMKKKVWRVRLKKTKLFTSSPILFGPELIFTSKPILVEPWTYFQFQPDSGRTPTLFSLQTRFCYNPEYEYGRLDWDISFPWFHSYFSFFLIFFFRGLGCTWNYGLKLQTDKIAYMISKNGPVPGTLRKPIIEIKEICPRIWVYLKWRTDKTD